MKERIVLSEGWVNFTRYPCKEGHIDRWMGDSINDPNNATKHQMQLNAFADFYRCNGGKWYSRHDFAPNFLVKIMESRELFTAEEIFEEYYVK